MLDQVPNSETFTEHLHHSQVESHTGLEEGGDVTQPYLGGVGDVVSGDRVLHGRALNIHMRFGAASLGGNLRETLERQNGGCWVRVAVPSFLDRRTLNGLKKPQASRTGSNLASVVDLATPCCSRVHVWSLGRNNSPDFFLSCFI